LKCWNDLLPKQDHWKFATVRCVLRCTVRLELDRASALQQVEDEYDDGKHKKDVYPSAHCVAAYQTKYPEDE
jgi:hypothetical protein